MPSWEEKNIQVTEFDGKTLSEALGYAADWLDDNNGAYIWDMSVDHSDDFGGWFVKVYYTRPKNYQRDTKEG